MKFSDIVSGKPPRKVVPLPLISGATVPVAIITLGVDGDSDALADAVGYAEKRGVPNAKPGDPLYERGLMVSVVFRSCVDVDVKDRDEPFFANPEQIGKDLDPDRLAWLFHVQRCWQDVAAPFPKTDDLAGFVTWLFKSMEVDDLREIPFDYLPASTRRSFLRRLVSLSLGHPSLKSLLGLVTDSVSNSSPSSLATSNGEDLKSPLTTKPLSKVRHAGKVRKGTKR